MQLEPGENRGFLNDPGTHRLQEGSPGRVLDRKKKPTPPPRRDASADLNHLLKEPPPRRDASADLKNEVARQRTRQ